MIISILFIFILLLASCSSHVTQKLYSVCEWILNIHTVPNNYSANEDHFYLFGAAWMGPCSTTLVSPTWRALWTDFQLLKVFHFTIATLTAAPHGTPRLSKTNVSIVAKCTLLCQHCDAKQSCNVIGVSLAAKWLTHGFCNDTGYPLDGISRIASKPFG